MANDPGMSDPTPQIDKEERRAAARQSIDAPGELRPCATYTRVHILPVHVHDMSSTGVGIVHTEPLPPGTRYVVKQNSFAEDQPRLYTVVRTTCKRDGSFLIGLEAEIEKPPPAPEPVETKPAKPRNFVLLAMLSAAILLTGVAVVVAIGAFR